MGLNHYAINRVLTRERRSDDLVRELICYKNPPAVRSTG
jgi:hypothetical protein